jgi:hypothetical protein
MIPGHCDPSRRPRGVAQVEFVANLPLIMGLLSLTVWIGVVLFGLSQRTIATSERSLPAHQDGPPDDAQPAALNPSPAPAGTDRAGIGPAAGAQPRTSGFGPRPPLQVPSRFDVLGEERLAEILRPITELARPVTPSIPVKP